MQRTHLWRRAGAIREGELLRALLGPLKLSLPRTRVLILKTSAQQQVVDGQRQ